MHALKALALAALFSGAPTGAEANTFEGPSLGVEAAYEDYGTAPAGGAAVAITAGWDFALSDHWVAGPLLRATVANVEQRTARPLDSNIATTRVEIEDQWGVGVRAGRVIADRVLLFGEVGYERFHVDAIRELRAPVCAPPDGCLISRLDASFDDDMLTLGAGAEWAVTDHLRLRGAYGYGNSEAYDRNRFSLGVAYQF